MAFFGLFRSRRHERAGYALYTVAVQTARDPAFYAGLGVPDTLDGRFDMIGLHVSLLMDRLRRAPSPGPELAQAVFDAMFSDMDFNLREMGVSDMSVGKRVKVMWEALNGRAQAYAAALEAGNEDAMTQAVARNVWRGAEPDANVRALARQAMAQAAHLAAQPLTELAAGRVTFLPSLKEAA